MWNKFNMQNIKYIILPKLFSVYLLIIMGDFLYGYIYYYMANILLKRHFQIP